LFNLIIARNFQINPHQKCSYNIKVKIVIFNPIKNTLRFLESGRFLFNAIMTNPWYVDYWLKLYEQLYSVFVSGDIQSIHFDNDFVVEVVNIDLLKLLLVHIE